MKKHLLSFICLFASISSAGAAQTPESLKAFGFSLPAAATRGEPRGLVAGTPVQGLSASRQTRWVGYVSLEGHDFASTGIDRIRLTVLGKMNVVDENGVIVLKNVPVAYAGVFQVGDRYVYGYAQIEAPIKGGVLRGAVKMQGFIYAGMARIRGNGQVSGVVTLAP